MGRSAGVWGGGAGATVYIATLDAAPFSALNKCD